MSARLAALTLPALLAVTIVAADFKAIANVLEPASGIHAAELTPATPQLLLAGATPRDVATITNAMAPAAGQGTLVPAVAAIGTSGATEVSNGLWAAWVGYVSGAVGIVPLPPAILFLMTAVAAMWGLRRRRT